MKVVYLDHQLLINQATWDTIKSLSDEGAIRVAISTWNIREIAQGLLERQERAEFLMSLTPLYLHDMIVLQRLELVSYLNEYLFRAGPIRFSPYTETFADFLSLNFKCLVGPQYSLADYLQAEGDLTGDIVDQRKMEHVEAMRAQLIDRSGVRLNEVQANHAKMALLIPRENGRGHQWKTDEIAEILSFCHVRRAELLLACPTILAEDALSHARKDNPNRRPKPNDTGDLFHGVMALANADIFVTDDKWARGCAERAKLSIERIGARLAAVVRSIDDLVTAVGR